MLAAPSNSISTCIDRMNLMSEWLKASHFYAFTGTQLREVYRAHNPGAWLDMWRLVQDAGDQCRSAHAALDVHRRNHGC
jgi:hypothetical protein